MTKDIILTKQTLKVTMAQMLKIIENVAHADMLSCPVMVQRTQTK